MQHETKQKERRRKKKKMILSYLVLFTIMNDER